MTDAAVKAALSDFDALWLTIHAEARGEPVEGQIAVGCVIRNRVTADLGHDAQPDWFGEGYRGVCLAPFQFSCWNDGDDANHRRVMETARLLVGDYAERSTARADPMIRQIKFLAEGILTGALLDNVHGATQYLTRQLFHANPPKWAQRSDLRVHTIGNQVFLA